MNASRVLLSLVLPATLVGWSCGSSGGGYSTPNAPSGGSSSADVTITINGNLGGMSFSPSDAAIKVGQTVSWRNADSITHFVTQDTSAGGNGGGYGGGGSGTGGFSTGDISSGSFSTPLKFTAAGAYGYHCQIHPMMVGRLTVTQ